MGREETIPTAKPWLRVSTAEAAKLLGTGEAQLSKALNATSEPSKVLEALKGAGDVDEKDEERLFGVTTTRYEGQLDPEKLVASAGGRTSRSGSTAPTSYGGPSSRFAIQRPA